MIVRCPEAHVPHELLAICPLCHRPMSEHDGYEERTPDVIVPPGAAQARCPHDLHPRWCRVCSEASVCAAAGE